MTASCTTSAVSFRSRAYGGSRPRAHLRSRGRHRSSSRVMASLSPPLTRASRVAVASGSKGGGPSGVVMDSRDGAEMIPLSSCAAGHARSLIEVRRQAGEPSMADQQTIGKYQVQRLLKRGGMGLLYLAFDPELERQVAIKVIRTDREFDHLHERFVREAKAAARLRHPNIVTIFEFGTQDGLPFIVMEYIPGQNLAEFIRRNPEEPLPLRLKLIDGACAGLALAHRANIVHRDVKPANLMVDVDRTLKILDFGIARMAGTGLTSTGHIMGTINYMSPEQMTGARVDHRSDIFAMGAVLYELVTGVRAFPGDRFDRVRTQVLHADPEPLQSICPDIDVQLESIIGKALAKHPDNRYQDFGELRLDLSTVCERLERSESATTDRTLVPILGDSDVDELTTSPCLATTVPLKPLVIATAVTRSRWVGLQTRALLLWTEKSA